MSTPEAVAKKGWIARMAGATPTSRWEARAARLCLPGDALW